MRIDTVNKREKRKTERHKMSLEFEVQRLGSEKITSMFVEVMKGYFESKKKVRVRRSEKRIQ